MSYLVLSEQQNSNKTIMIFTEGTILKPKSVLSLYSHKSYIPIGSCVQLIKGWHADGADIVYCTSRKKQQAIEMANVLMLFGFAGSRLYYRDKGKKYKDIVEEVKPDILIEDDCRSIGGSWQMCITKVNPQIREQIKSFVVKEFKGIDHLPQKLAEL